MVLGLTGGIASGKSTASAFLAELGANVIDADKISRQLMSPGTLLSRSVLDYFGKDYSLPTDPTAIDRKKLSAAIFHDELIRKQLESLVHSAIISEMNSQIAKLKVCSQGIIVADVPLLFEAKLEPHFDKILVIWCSAETQRTRLQARLPEVDDRGIAARVASQIPLDQKREMGDYVINSDLPLDQMKSQLQILFESLSSKP